MAAAAAGGALRELSQREKDIQMMLAADVYFRTKGCDFHLERFVYRRRSDDAGYTMLYNTWEKLESAALKYAQDTAIASVIDVRPTPQTSAIQLQIKRVPGSLELNKKCLPRRHRVKHGR